MAIVKKSLLLETPFPSLLLLPFPSPSAALGILLHMSLTKWLSLWIRVYKKENNVPGGFNIVEHRTRALGLMAICFSQPNVAVALITELRAVATYFLIFNETWEDQIKALHRSEKTGERFVKKEYLMLSKINSRQWKLAELTRYNPLGANLSFVIIKSLTSYGLFAHGARYLLNAIQEGMS